MQVNSIDFSTLTKTQKIGSKPNKEIELKTPQLANDSVEISNKDNKKKGKKFNNTPFLVLGLVIFSGVVGAAIQKRKSFPSITKMTSEYEEVLGRKLTDKETAKLHKKCQTTKEANWNFVDSVIDAFMFL